MNSYFFWAEQPIKRTLSFSLSLSSRLYSRANHDPRHDSSEMFLPISLLSFPVTWLIKNKNIPQNTKNLVKDKLETKNYVTVTWHSGFLVKLHESLWKMLKTRSLVWKCNPSGPWHRPEDSVRFQTHPERRGGNDNNHSPASSNIHRDFCILYKPMDFIFYTARKHLGDKPENYQHIHQLSNSPSAAQCQLDHPFTWQSPFGIILVFRESKYSKRDPETLTVSSVVIHLLSKADTGVCLSSFTPQKPSSALSI